MNTKDLIVEKTLKLILIKATALSITKNSLMEKLEKYAAFAGTFALSILFPVAENESRRFIAESKNVQKLSVTSSPAPENITDI